MLTKFWSVVGIFRHGLLSFWSAFLDARSTLSMSAPAIPGRAAKRPFSKAQLAQQVA
jgi:hypothetical protein